MAGVCQLAALVAPQAVRPGAHIQRPAVHGFEREGRWGDTDNGIGLGLWNPRHTAAIAIAAVWRQQITGADAEMPHMIGAGAISQDGLVQLADQQIDGQMQATTSVGAAESTDTSAIDSSTRPRTA
jgi:hypothetical protein